ncbi:hypothetical protein V8B55DRAFT_1355268 [Mucor lusitanicus]
MKFDLHQHLQQRRKSFPPQKDIASSMTTTTTPCTSSQSTNNISSVLVDRDANICPLTEENLAIHTQNLPPSKDARRRNCRLFVESQIPVVAMELKLQQQREREISDLEAQSTANIEFANPFHDPNEPLEEERSRRSRWFTKLKHWIRMDSGTRQQNKTRHLSWSAGTEKEDHKMVDATTACQKRDSGISIFSNNHQQSKQRRRSSPIAAIPITRQPKFSPSNDPHEELITYQYPRMRRKSSIIHAAAPTPTTSDDKHDNQHAVEKSHTLAVSNTPPTCLDCKGSQQDLFKSIQQGTVV